MFATKINLRDLLIAVGILACAGLLFCAPLFFRSPGAVLVITTPDRTMEYDLSHDREIKLTSRGIELLIVIKDGAARVQRSTCPDGICRSGALSDRGDTTVCAPAGVRLGVRGGDGNVDFVAG